MTGFQPTTTMCKNKHREIVGEKKDVFEVSATYSAAL